MRIVSLLLLSILYIFPIEVKTNILGSEHTMPFVSSFCVPSWCILFLCSCFCMAESMKECDPPTSTASTMLFVAQLFQLFLLTKLKTQNLLTENQTKQLANKSWFRFWSFVFCCILRNLKKYLIFRRDWFAWMVL